MKTEYNGKPVVQARFPANSQIVAGQSECFIEQMNYGFDHWFYLSGERISYNSLFCVAIFRVLPYLKNREQ